MRRVRVWAGIVAGALCLGAVVGCTPEQPAGAVGATSAGTEATPVAPGTLVAPGTSATATSVLRVIDGDTFRTADGLEVRVLGIDSCEAGTPGGRRATAAARTLLVGAAVTLTAEPGVDRDRYGRALRYVTTNGRDLAETMVRADHTAIYARGRNDASPARQATLRRLDPGGRTCGADPAPATSRPARPAVAADVDRPRTRKPVAAAVPERAPARSRPAPARPRPKPAASAPVPASAFYKNCAAAKAAGAAPLRRGQAGYSAKLDRDGDGVACE